MGIQSTQMNEVLHSILTHEHIKELGHVHVCIQTLKYIDKSLRDKLNSLKHQSNGECNTDDELIGEKRLREHSVHDNYKHAYTLSQDRNCCHKGKVRRVGVKGKNKCATHEIDLIKKHAT